MVCKSWKHPKLIDLMYRISVPLPPHFPLNAPETEENRIYYLNQLISKKIEHSIAELQTWPFERILYYYIWYTSINQKTGKKFKREEFCEKIKEQMEALGILRID